MGSGGGLGPPGVEGWLNARRSSVGSLLGIKTDPGRGKTLGVKNEVLTVS